MEKVLMLLIVVTALFVGPAKAGIVIGGTRIIFDGKNKEASASIKNTSKADVFLIQSWLESEAAGSKPPFIVTPPLFRISAGEENLLRIVLTDSSLPKDRESVFWLNVKSIPAQDTSKSASNVLQVVIKSRLKFFYRPEGLEGTPEDAWQRLSPARSGGQLELTNPTPYYVSLYSLKVDGAEIKEADLNPPKGKVRFALPSAAASRVSWQAISDYGSISSEEQRTL